MTKYQELEQMVVGPFSKTGLRRSSKVHRSLQEILETGEARTGMYVGYGRHTNAVIWTNEVDDCLKRLGISHEVGNDAPKGGARGEYVRVIMPAFLKVTRKLIAAVNFVMRKPSTKIEMFINNA